jgi:hypothetical protein
MTWSFKGVLMMNMHLSAGAPDPRRNRAQFSRRALLGGAIGAALLYGVRPLSTTTAVSVVASPA